MRNTFILIATFFSLNLFASAWPGIKQTQNTELEATFETNLDFKTESDGFVIIEFTLSQQLDQTHQDEVDELTSENATRIDIQINGLQVKVKLKSDLSNANVWGKVFYSMGVTQFTFGSGTDQIKQPFDIFSNHFNL